MRDVLNYEYYRTEDVVAICATEHIVEPIKNAVGLCVVDENLEIIDISNSETALSGAVFLDTASGLSKLQKYIEYASDKRAVSLVAKIIYLFDDISPSHDYRYKECCEYPEDRIAFVVLLLVNSISKKPCRMKLIAEKINGILNHYGANATKKDAVDRIVENELTLGYVLLRCCGSQRY